MIISRDAALIRGETDLLAFVASSSSSSSSSGGGGGGGADSSSGAAAADLMTASDFSREFESMSFLDDGAHNTQMSASSCRFLSLGAANDDHHQASPPSLSFPATCALNSINNAGGGSGGGSGSDMIDKLKRERELEEKQFQSSYS
jgi:hypothetical protein